MSLPKKGKPIPADLAREYLKTIAGALRKEGNSGWHSKSFYHSPLMGTGYRQPAFELAAAVLERVADGEQNFGDLIEGRGLGLHYQQAVDEVCRQATLARFRGQPITKEQAFALADEALGRNDSKRLFLAYQRHHNHVIDLPFKGMDDPACSRIESKQKG